MAFTNSSMVAYTKLSPNHSGQRTMAIDRITPHCVVGQCTAEGLGDWFAKSSTQASSNYGIGKDGAYYNMRHGICFETQYYPDSIHHANFPSPVYKAGETLESTTEYRFY